MADYWGGCVPLAYPCTYSAPAKAALKQLMSQVDKDALDQQAQEKRDMEQAEKERDE